MKRFTAILIALALILTLPLAISQAAGKSEKGDLIIASLTTTGEVGEIVKVNFELYANLPEDRKLDSLSQKRGRSDLALSAAGRRTRFDDGFRLHARGDPHSAVA